MPYVTNQGVRIHYQIEGEGPPLVLQHGFSGDVSEVLVCYSLGVYETQSNP